MWKHLPLLPRTIVVATVLASGLATAAFAFNETVSAKGDRCCLLITRCNGNTCTDHPDCLEPGGSLRAPGGFCCSECN